MTRTWKWVIALGILGAVVLGLTLGLVFGLRSSPSSSMSLTPTVTVTPGESVSFSEGPLSTGERVSLLEQTPPLLSPVYEAPEPSSSVSREIPQPIPTTPERSIPLPKPIPRPSRSPTISIPPDLIPELDDPIDFIVNVLSKPMHFPDLKPFLPS